LRTRFREHAFKNFLLRTRFQELAFKNSLLNLITKYTVHLLDFNEFIEMMVRRDAKVEEDVMHAFKVFDRDGDGYISVEELR
jgi:Ca2+-binding EF-hand superfamily protein